MGLVVGVGLFLWPGPLARTAGAAQPLPRLFQAPSYHLKDQLGKPVSSKALLGKVRVVVTLDPYCPTLCPLTLSKVQNLEARLRARHLTGGVRCVAFDIDKAAGAGDLRAFFKREGVDPAAPWLTYLWGPPGAVRDVVRYGYHTSYYSGPNEKAAAAEASSLQARMANPVRASPFTAGMGDPALATPASRCTISGPLRRWRASPTSTVGRSIPRRCGARCRS